MADMLLGAHLSIAGGVYKAVELADGYGFNALAIFVRQHRRWESPPLTNAQVKLFAQARQRAKTPIRRIAAHASYLVNLAGQRIVRQKSMAAVADELDRCGRLGIDYYVMHPGSAGQAGRRAAITRLAAALNALTADCQYPVRLLLESTAACGHLLGGRFEELAEILSLLERPEQFGVCLDSCHIFASGYDIRTPAAYAATFEQFDRIVGRERLFAIHLNDSKGGLGSRLDRHEHIGQGQIGLSGFANFMKDKSLNDVPLILETPKGLTADGRDWDKVNARTLMRLRK